MTVSEFAPDGTTVYPTLSDSDKKEIKSIWVDQSSLMADRSMYKAGCFRFCGIVVPLFRYVQSVIFIPSLTTRGENSVCSECADPEQCVSIPYQQLPRTAVISSVQQTPISTTPRSSIASLSTKYPGSTFEYRVGCHGCLAKGRPCDLAGVFARDSDDINEDQRFVLIDIADDPPSQPLHLDSIATSYHGIELITDQSIEDEGAIDPGLDDSMAIDVLDQDYIPPNSSAGPSRSSSQLADSPIQVVDDTYVTIGSNPAVQEWARTTFVNSYEANMVNCVLWGAKMKRRWDEARLEIVKLKKELLDAKEQIRDHQSQPESSLSKAKKRAKRTKKSAQIPLPAQDSPNPSTGEPSKKRKTTDK